MIANSKNENDYVMWLLSVSGIGSAKVIRLVNSLGSCKNVWESDTVALAGVLSRDDVKRIAESKRTYDFSKQSEKLDKHKARFVCLWDDEYPELLKNIYDPPAGLYIRGQGFGSPNKISVIGSRLCSEYGIETATAFCRDLAGYGVDSVSGMARGIDSAAHRGSLSGGGGTVAVLGCGVDICYPPEHRKLMDEIIEQGVVVSEYPIGTPPMKIYFPQRNRLISGLSMALLVVEAGLNSGTQITVDFALEQGRMVMAVPGPITSPFCKGTNRMILEGATPALSAVDILLEMGIVYDEPAKPVKLKLADTSLTETELRLYDMIEPDLTVQDLLEQTGLTLSELITTLTKLELDMYIKKLPGQRYMKTQ